MKKIIITVFVLFILLVIGAFMLNTKNRQKLPMHDEIGSQETSQSKSGDVKDKPKIIAGSSTVYKEFSKPEYDKAVAEGKVIVLNFYANWCPICRAEEPDLISGFNQLSNPNVVGFRVNFKDDETDAWEDALAKEHGISYQHSKVIIKNGQVIYRKIAEKWDASKLISEIGSL